LLALTCFAVAAVLAVLLRSPRALVLTGVAAFIYYYPVLALLVVGAAVVFSLTR
jgi:hypothetical protein